MKLIDALIKELPDRGGWPVESEHAWADTDGEVRFRGGGCVHDFYPSTDIEHSSRVPIMCVFEDDPDYIVTKDEYEIALSMTN